ncbi:MAG: sigma-70 family RNA polymerase sigma factor, partial [Clostridia bacterium]|nr:sigma-70 family RNA polymerase sigma factor [Clostridia bacterium]
REIPLETIENEPDRGSVEDLSLDFAAVDAIMLRLKAEPERTQRMFLLYYGYGMKLGDIAKELGTTEAGVKSCLVRVRRKLRADFGEENAL